MLGNNLSTAANFHGTVMKYMEKEIVFYYVVDFHDSSVEALKICCVLNDEWHELEVSLESLLQYY